MTRIHYEVDDDLHRRVKTKAASKGITLRSAVTEALERWAGKPAMKSDQRPEVAECQRCGDPFRWATEWRHNRGDTPKLIRPRGGSPRIYCSVECDRAASRERNRLAQQRRRQSGGG